MKQNVIWVTMGNQVLNFQALNLPTRGLHHYSSRYILAQPWQAAENTPESSARYEINSSLIANVNLNHDHAYGNFKRVPQLEV